MRVIILLILVTLLVGCELEKTEITEVYIESPDGPVVVIIDSKDQDIADAAKKREDVR